MDGRLLCRLKCGLLLGRGGRMRIARWLLFFLFSLFCSFPPLRAAYYAWTSRAHLAYDKVMQLRFGEARAQISLLRQEEADNLIYVLIEDYIDFFTLYIGEEEEVFHQLEQNKTLRLSLLRREGDSSSPWHDYLQADILLHWALARLKFEQYATSFLEVNKAFKLLSQNTERFPDFLPNKKDLGILHAIAGTIPDEYSGMVSWLTSLEGSIAQGRSELESVLEQMDENYVFRDETYVLYAYLLLHLADETDEAWKVIEQSGLQAEQSPLSCFVMANMAMRLGKNDLALAFLERCPQGRVYYPLPYLHFMRGICLQRRLSPEATRYFERFLSGFRGRHFVKEAWQKLAWQALLEQDFKAYRACIAHCRTAGVAVTDGDKAALREANSGLMPQPDLLRIRLLFDGGYYEQAEKLLEQFGPEDFGRHEHRLEFVYRSARLAQALQKREQAFAKYRLVLEMGADDPWYYACKAALELGRLCEHQGQLAEARSYYRRCLELKPAAYRTGLHQAAKAGLKRLGK